MKSCLSKKKKGKSFVKGQCLLKTIWKPHRNCLLSALLIFLEYEPVTTCLLNHSTEVWRYCLPSSRSNCFDSWTKHTSLSCNNSELKGDFKSLCVTLSHINRFRHWENYTELQCKHMSCLETYECQNLGMSDSMCAPFRQIRWWASVLLQLSQPTGMQQDQKH